MSRFYTRAMLLNSHWFDQMHHYWEGRTNQRIIGGTLVISFLGSLLLILGTNMGVIPAPFDKLFTTNYFHAIELAFTLLLMVEVLSLVLTLSHSVAVSMGKQFELLALILLRKTFKDYSVLTHPIDWSVMQHPLRDMVIDSFGALLIFAGLLLVYRLQKHRSITRDESDKQRFVMVKKFIANLLLLAYVVLGIMYIWQQWHGHADFVFFEEFYTILIFSDILLVLVSLRYSYSFLVVFRNSGFAFATLVIRLGLGAPTPLNVALGLSALVFVLGLTFVYNHFNKELGDQHI